MDYKEKIKKITELNIQGKYEEAIKILKSIKKEGEEDIIWYYKYSCALISTNKFKRALDILKVGISKSKDDFPYAHLNLGMMYYWKGKFVDAFKMIEEGLKKCKTYDKRYILEFQETLKAIYLFYPFVNKENPYFSVLKQKFLNYDENADNRYKIKRIEKEKKDLRIYLGDYKRERLNCSLHINGRISEQFKFGYEEILSSMIAINRLGILKESKILKDENERPYACEINFEIYKNIKNYKNKFLDLLKSQIFIPKGSYIKFINKKKEEKIDVGEYEILALGINAHNLPEEILQRYSAPKLIEIIQIEANSKKIDGGYYFNYDETIERIWLRFLGKYYDKMENIIKQIIKNYPLCKDTVIINETHLNKK